MTLAAEVPDAFGQGTRTLDVDDAGRTIFRVDIAPDRGLPRAAIGNLLDAHIEMGPGADNSVLAMYDDSAGATKANAVGFVSTGPYDGGIAGAMGGGMAPASSLLGKKAAK
jgi:hypothetical protein